MDKAGFEYVTTEQTAASYKKAKKKPLNVKYQTFKRIGEVCIYIYSNMESLKTFRVKRI